MFKILKSIFALLLVVVVVVTTGGFSIFTHQCDCCNSYELSLSELNACCETEGEEYTCDLDAQKSSCCAEKIHVDHKNHSCKNDHCCQINTRFFRLGNLFLNTRDIQVDKIQIPVQLQQIIHTETIQIEFVKKLIHISENSPPKIPFKKFVVFAHQLKIPF